MVEKLVAFDTTSRNSNLELVEFVRAYLAKHGVECRLVHDASGKKANLYATLGPADQPGIALSGHTDVVPVDGQAWDTDPWKVTRQDGRIYGRGVSDMKSFVAIVLTFVPEFMRRGLKTPINLALSYDEEVGCLGVRRLLEVAAGDAGEALGLHHRRAHQHEGHGQPQGQEEHPLPCARPRGAIPPWRRTR